MPHSTVNGVPLYYEVTGTGKQHVVCIHGMGLSHFNWMEQTTFFSKRAKVLTYDIRGHGRSGSSCRSEPPEDYLQLLVNDLHGLLEKLEFQPVFLMAYSSGCAIALEFIKQYPEWVWGAALSGPFHKVSNALLYSKLLGSLLLGKLQLKKWLSHQVARSNGATEEQIHLFRYDAKRIRWKEAEQWIHACLRFDITKELSHIRIPMLLLYGGNERHMMGYRRQFLQTLRNAEICLLPKQNHACPTKGKDLFNYLVHDFMETYRPISLLSALHTDQDESDPKQNPQNFSEGYFIRDPHETDGRRSNQDKWTH